MPQQIAKLRATIAELERELASLSELDDETRALLTEAASELQEALGRQPHKIRQPLLTERLQSAAEEFETSHPTLFGIVTRMIDSLAQLGI